MGDVQDIGITSNSFKSIKCKNCGKEIRNNSPPGYAPWWYHIHSGMRDCIEAPFAEPVEEIEK